jgi:hypothetical protein
MTDGLPLFDWKPPPLVLATPLYTINRDNKFDIQLNVANLREHVLGRLLGGGKLELKSETHLWRRTGNICLEYQQRGRRSGFTVCQGRRLGSRIERRRGQNPLRPHVVVPLHFFTDWLLQGGGE